MSPKKGRKPGAEAPETPAVAPETPETAAETPAREGGVSEIPRVAETPRYKRKVGPEEFWRACETYGITPVSRLYVYRLWPVIDRALVGIKNSYIAVIKGKACAGFGPADILRRFGSGKYQLSFNDPNRKPDTRVHVTEIELMDPEQPPILDPAELVAGHPENAGYVEGLRVKGLMREGESMNSGDAVKELAGVTRDALHMAREGAGDADKEIERALKLAAAMRPAGDEGLAKIMLQSQDRLIGLLLAERKAAPASNPLEAVNTTLTLFNKLGVRVGGGGGGGRLGQI